MFKYSKVTYIDRKLDNIIYKRTSSMKLKTAAHRSQMAFDLQASQSEG